MKIKYTETDHTALELVKPLWEQLRDHHASISNYFSEQILQNTFEQRSRDLLAKAEQGDLHIILANDEISEKLIGYCISSISKGSQGEIDSIFILENYRSNGVGDALMRQTLDWFKKHNVDNISISVLFGNENTLQFYNKYGFYPRYYLLKSTI